MKRTVVLGIVGFNNLYLDKLQMEHIMKKMIYRGLMRLTDQYMGLNGM